jgi:hypothetical protein
MKELTLYDIMGSDHYIVADVENDKIRTMVIDENDDVVYNEISHKFAWDSLVSFAKMVISQDEKIQKELF